MANDFPARFALPLQEGARDSLARAAFVSREKVVHVNDRTLLQQGIDKVENRDRRLVEIAVDVDQGDFSAAI